MSFLFDKLGFPKQEYLKSKIVVRKSSNMNLMIHKGISTVTFCCDIMFLFVGVNYFLCSKNTRGGCHRR